MKRHHRTAVAFLLLGLVACGDQPLEPTPSDLGGRQVLLDRITELADDNQNAGLPAVAQHAESERLLADIMAWNGSHPLDAIRIEAGVVADSELLTTAAVPIFPRAGCKPCPFIIVRGNRIGILRSEGPCRPGAGLERCFYTWIYMGTQLG